MIEPYTIPLSARVSGLAGLYTFSKEVQILSEWLINHLDIEAQDTNDIIEKKLERGIRNSVQHVQRSLEEGTAVQSLSSDQLTCISIFTYPERMRQIIDILKYHKKETVTCRIGHKEVVLIDNGICVDA